MERGENMPKLFNRTLILKIEGEVYDQHTKPEDIIKNYTWSFNNDDRPHSFSLTAHHKDSRGLITKVAPLNKIGKWKKPDTEYFII